MVAGGLGHAGDKGSVLASDSWVGLGPLVFTTRLVTRRLGPLVFTMTLN